MQGNVLIILITNRLLDYVMDGKDKSTFHAPYHVTAITFLIIGIIVTGIFVCTLVLNQNHTAMAQQQQPTLGGISFDIDNMTFSHHMASVNGIQLHYVIGGQGDPVVLIH
jgi:hypothetical protein